MNSFNTNINCYSESEALEESSKCLKCRNPKCVSACPLNNNIPKFIELISEGKLAEARMVLDSTSGFSDICSYVCYSENKCMGSCIRKKIDKAVNIKKLEKYVSLNTTPNPDMKSKNNIKLCVIGSGPAGLAFARDALINGYDVTIFDRHNHLGGLLRYAIPTFRLPRVRVKAIETELLGLGLKFITKNVQSIEEIPGFDYYFLATGTSKTKSAGIEGETLNGVLDWTTFLSRPNSYNYIESKDVCIIGGGNVAIDCARVASRLGANVSILYRRGINDMPCNLEELNRALSENIKIIEYRKPLSISKKNSLIVETIVTKPGEVASDGRRSIIDTSEHQSFNYDYIIRAIGSEAEEFDNVSLSKGKVLVDEHYQTNITNVYAIGDVVSGATTVTDAIRHGKDVFSYIDKMIKSKQTRNTSSN